MTKKCAAESDTGLCWFITTEKFCKQSQIPSYLNSEGHVPRGTCKRRAGEPGGGGGGGGGGGRAPRGGVTGPRPAGTRCEGPGGPRRPRGTMQEVTSV